MAQHIDTSIQGGRKNGIHASATKAVSYTHLTLPTILRV